MSKRTTGSRMLGIATLSAMVIAVVGAVLVRPTPDGSRSDPGCRVAPVPAVTPVARLLGHEDPPMLAASQPVAFVPNQGQWDGDFSHKARMGAMTVFLQERGWTFTLVERPQRAQPDPFARMTAQPEPASAPARGVAVQMHFEGGAGPAFPIEEQRLPGVHNYFLGNDPERWRSNVPLHGAVLLSGLYPGIDLRARSQDGHFEYDLLVEPGAELEQVVVTVEGVDGLRLDPDGSLIIDTALGPVRQPLPTTWQVTASEARQELVCRYVLLAPDRFGFDASDWDRDLALVVDPGLLWSTFLGGTGGNDWVRCVAVDAIGVTVAGDTESTNFPVTPGSYSVTHSGGAGGSFSEVFVSRFWVDGSALLWSTYVGGNAIDTVADLDIDGTGNVTIAGHTSSGNFPTTPGAYDTTYDPPLSNLFGMAFVARLDPSGSNLLWSTYLGSTDGDWANGLKVEGNGDVIVAGETLSAGFPVTPGAYDTTFGGVGPQGYGDGFVSRLDASGSSLVWSTFLGAAQDDVLRDLAVDSVGNATVVGWTNSPAFPVTSGAYDTILNGPSDAVVARLSSNGASILWSTFLGGSDADNGTAVDLDTLAGVTVGGWTGSTDFPTSSAFWSSYSGAPGWTGADGFVTQLDPGGGSLTGSTYLGGSGHDQVSDIALQPWGHVTVVGHTGSQDFPSTPGSYDSVYNGGMYDDFIAVLSAGVSNLHYSSYLGGAGDFEWYPHVALDDSGEVIVAGHTSSPNFPTTPGAYDTSFNGPPNTDSFIARLDLGPSIGLSQPGGPGTPITIDNGYLIPGNTYYNIFSLDLCPAGPGTGPYLGLCVTTLPNAQFIVLQASLPVGSPPFHFVATASSMSWGPYTVGPGTLDAVCLDVTSGVLGSYSAVTRITIQ